MDDSDTDSDDWAKGDLPELPSLPIGSSSSKAASMEHHNHQNIANEDNDDDDGWEQKLVHRTNDKVVVTKTDQNDVNSDLGEPIIIVDMTTLSQLLSLSEIHCQFDPNSVNDVVAVKALRHQIESNYDTYKKNMDFISERIIIPCGSSVYRPALIELRNERPGHYFYPIFPPKK